MGDCTVAYFVGLKLQLLTFNDLINSIHHHVRIFSDQIVSDSWRAVRL